uniref:Guanylate cyclase activator 1g n=1 Tax=Neogobius melanostomus TaxID=47308 RepID=A0A8C6TNE4_9GOBI
EERRKKRDIDHQTQPQTQDLQLDSIQGLYRSFIQECPSGSLHLHEFRRMFGVKHDSAEAQYVENIFRAFDMNHDNTMDFMEYVAALHLVLRGRIEDKLRWSFKVFDGDNNGYLDQQEVTKIIRKSSATQERDLLDMSPDQICERIFRDVDINNDGEITLEEFLQGVQRSLWLQDFLHLDINPSAWVKRRLSERRLTGT